MRCALRDSNSEWMFEPLRRTKYGDMLREVAIDELRNSNSHIMSIAGNSSSNASSGKRRGVGAAHNAADRKKDR